MRKPRVLCLHGFRESGAILRKQVDGKWPESVISKLDLIYPDATFSVQGKSSSEDIYDPPYFEWFQSNQDFTEYMNFDKCLAYIEDFMIKHGPFDGLMGKSQGGILAGVLPGLQKKGLALTKVPQIKFIIVIVGGESREPKVAKQAYSSPIHCPSLHFIGENDKIAKNDGLALTKLCLHPVVIIYPGGHEVPKLEDKAEKQVLEFLDTVQKVLIPRKGLKAIEVFRLCVVRFIIWIGRSLNP